MCMVRFEGTVLLELDYADYKDFESQLERWRECEHSESTPSGYCKTFVFRVGPVTLQVKGPWRS